MAPPRMRLLVDENVPSSVTDFLRQRCHEVILVREVLLPGSADQLVAEVGNRMSAIVVTWNHKHFKQLIARAPISSRQHFTNLGRITSRCSEARGRLRLEQLIRSIEFEYEQAQGRGDRRLMVEITETTLNIVR